MAIVLPGCSTEPCRRETTGRFGTDPQQLGGGCKGLGLLPEPLRTRRSRRGSAGDEHPRAGGGREGRGQGLIAPGRRSRALWRVPPAGSRTPRVAPGPGQRGAGRAEGSVGAELSPLAMLEAWLSQRTLPWHPAPVAPLETLMSSPLFPISGCGRSSGTGCTIPFTGACLPCRASSARATGVAAPNTRPGAGDFDGELRLPEPCAGGRRSFAVGWHGPTGSPGRGGCSGWGGDAGPPAALPGVLQGWAAVSRASGGQQAVTWRFSKQR